ncbi:PadR family transcriptional regulator [Clostridium sp. 'deep sea']|uniref:PadR family transcriptional regulator n=1 Tax=Clostridium sp. 'deep sea' TaxID=2779445 RepID=UPI001896593E|nr:PadR family transcriptional regulator [Clostridium sp. 'deep sea']QOR35466.1 PadR family transcriptional regulator [Clostridium sp. 'deep sea']
MIKALILYFLSIKPTHGYEIQKYIQLNDLDDWTRIQSGSIYYALAKLNKDQLIELQNEVEVESRTRKIYNITDKGKEELKKLLLKQFKKPIYFVGSDKFLAYPFINEINKNKLVNTVNTHITELQTKLKQLHKWQKHKVDEKSLGIEKLSFEMMITNVKMQIKWHEALVNEIDQCIELSNRVRDLIKSVDFSQVEMSDYQNPKQNTSITELKDQILNNPDQAEQLLKQYISKLK